MGSANQDYVVRQPIMNRRHGIVGYELWFDREADVVGAEPSLPCISADAFARLVRELDFDVLLGGRLGFVPIKGKLPAPDFIKSLPKGRFVLELPRQIKVDDSLVKQCREASRSGVRIALMDFTRRDPRDALLEVVHYAKVDAIATSENDLRQLSRKLQKNDVLMTASRVDLPSQLTNLVDSGVDLFQGFYFTHTEEGKAAAVDAERASLVELLTRLHQNPEFDEIADTLKKSGSLSVSLLRLVNSLQMARAQKISSVMQALMMIGRQGLARWLNLLLFAEGERGGPTGPLFPTAATRGKTMEILYLESFGLESFGRDADEEKEADPAEIAFLVGMMSLVHALLGISPEQALEELNLSDEIREALMTRRGPYGELLALTEQVEVGNFAQAGQLMSDLGLTLQQLRDAQLEAYAWVNEL